MLSVRCVSVRCEWNLKRVYSGGNEMNPDKIEFNWTVNLRTGRSNSSDEFEFLCKVVERLIRDNAHMLISGHAENTAGLIMAQLAHKYGIVPTKSLEEMQEVI